jgi:predicted O-linked N-acetylglucosamine transferase (SPINDLY family)
MNKAVLQNALSLRRAGRLAEAAQIYNDVLRTEPTNFEALHALGIVRYQCGELNEAERLIGEAVRVNPGAAEAHYNRGALLLKMNRHEDALACFEQALALRPNYPEALGNCGAALIGLSRYVEALAAFDRFVVLHPSLAEAWNCRGGALMRLKRHDEAHADFTKALSLKPQFPDARRNRATASFALKNFAATFADADQALALDVKDAVAWEQRADALAELDRREEAVASYDRVLALKPQSADALYNRATNLIALRRHAESARGYADVLRLRPDYPYALGHLGFTKLCICDWQGLEQDAEAVMKGLRAGTRVSSPFDALAIGTAPAEAHIAARLWVEHGYPASPAPLWHGERYAHQKIRIAYISANFHDHAVARLMAGVWEHHDRTRFECYAISFGPDDKWPMRARLVRAFDRFIDVRQQRAEQIARTLRDLEIDIAVDLMGYTEASRPDILPFRAAPVQVNFLGYPGTLGADYIDYVVADRVVIPESERPHFTENVVTLPGCYLPADANRAIAERRPSRKEARLPERGFVFCCFNHNYKITPAMFDIWMRLLQQVEGSVLWLSAANDTAVRNLGREAQMRGVSPERLVFASYVPRDEDHLARLGLADLFLDTLPYNAHATASDALWAGVPVLTTPGAGFPSRVAASLLQAVGLPEMIAPSLVGYEESALRLAGDPAALAAIRAKLARNRDTQPLFETARFTRNLERAYETMWEGAQSGVPPASFAVENAL